MKSALNILGRQVQASASSCIVKRGLQTSAPALRSKLKRKKLPKPKEEEPENLLSRDGTDEAESSNAPRPKRGEKYPGETDEEAFARELQQVQKFRLQRNALSIKLPFLPPSVKPPPKPSPLETSLSTLLAAGAALGHSHKYMHSEYAQYIYGKRAGLSIIDLDKTLPMLRRAAALVRDVSKADGVVLFVGTSPGMERAVDRAAQRLGDGGFGVTKWLPGIITNAETFVGESAVTDGSYIPDLVVFLNPEDNLAGIRECTLRHIPTIGVVDSSVDPRIVTYPIPANAESIRTAELIAGTLSLAGQEGRRLRMKQSDERDRLLHAPRR